MELGENATVRLDADNEFQPDALWRIDAGGRSQISDDDYVRSHSVQSSHFEMVEMDKIVSRQRGWVTPASTQPTKKGDRSNGEQQSHLFLLY
ncbi:hypothetical protein QUA41_22510 [Microcoleus sp. Pol11C1]|uniref:hypothetical protein n=1 Tax=unclassified Microcoleus TaxID=2642155 RepID=UPI002FD15DAB